MQLNCCKGFPDFTSSLRQRVPKACLREMDVFRMRPWDYALKTVPAQAVIQACRC